MDQERDEFQIELERYRVLAQETTDPMARALLRDILDEMEKVDNHFSFQTSSFHALAGARYAHFCTIPRPNECHFRIPLRESTAFR